MKPKVRAARALAAYAATRSLRLVSLISLVMLVVLFVLMWLLATQLSSWWWMLLIPLMLLTGIGLLLRFIIGRLIHATYPDPLSQGQRETLDILTSKVARLAETRSTPLPILALITLKDIVVHRDAKTVRDLFDDSKALTGDLRELEKQFKER